MKFKSQICRWSDYKAITIIADNETASCRIHIYDDEPKMAVISDLYVAQGERGKGIASKLIQYCIDHAKAQDCTAVSLRSDNDDFVRQWYMRLGFEIESSQVWLRKKI
jgi:GNAT superfamily N-acetyltransferase